MFSTGCVSVERKNIHRDRTACGAEKFSDTSSKFSIGLPGGGDTVIYAGGYYGNYSRYGAYGPAYGSSVHPGGNPWAAAVATEAAMGGYVSSEPWWVREREQQRRTQPVYGTSTEIEVILTPAEYQSQHWHETQRNYGVHQHQGRGNSYTSPHLPGQPPPRSGLQPHRSR